MKNLVPFISLLIFLGILALAVYFLSRRFAWFFNISYKRFYLMFSIAVFASLTGVIYIMRSNASGFFSHVIANISSIGMGLLLILLIVTLAFHLLHFAIKVKPVYYGIAVIATTLIVGGYSYWNARNTIVISQEFTIPGLSEPMRIMQYSDVHLGHFRGKRTMQKLVDMTKAEAVDAVVITGDLFDGRAGLDNETVEPLRQLNVPVYFVQGNHDGYTGADTIKKILRKNGIIVLSNEVAHLNGLQIVGLDYMIADEGDTDMMHAPLNGNTIRSVLNSLEIEINKPSLLLHHNPIGVEYAHAAGIDLYLAGHTHAGQLFPVTLINKRLFRYNKGVYNYKTTKIYVSQGSGTFGPPMRLGTKSEITLITLNP